MYKKFLSVFMAVILSMTFVIGNTVSAAIIVPDSPMYSYTRSCSSELTTSGTTATCKSSATGYYNKTTKIVFKQTLQKKNSSGGWDDVTNAAWTSTVYSYQGSTTNYKYSLSSGTYRLKTVFTVYADTSFETITKYSKEKTI